MNESDRAIAAMKQAPKIVTDSYMAAPKGDDGPVISFPIGAMTLSDLENYGEEIGGRVTEVTPRIKRTQAVLLWTADEKPLLFANPELKSYRNLFIRSVEVGHGRDVSGITDFHVDHAASQGSAERLGFRYSLLVAVHGVPNVSYSDVEKNLCDDPRRGLIYPNLLQIMKINNIPLLSAKNDITAGLGIMTGMAVEQKIIRSREAEKFYGMGIKVGARVASRPKP
ncbi:MAG: hypothetical protein JO055_16585 [Alphaproteobacteria bacterium]|nr:hypothetical protein [Alphaproteobacteria bacterium]